MVHGIEKLRTIYDGMVRRGDIKEVPADVVRDVRERFISFYSRFDSRLRRIRRERISVAYNSEGRIRVTCVYHRKAYGQVYDA